MTPVPSRPITPRRHRSDEHSSGKRLQAAAAHRTMQSLDIQGFTYDSATACSPTSPQPSATAAVGALERKTLSPTNMEFRIEIQLLAGPRPLRRHRRHRSRTHPRRSRSSHRVCTRRNISPGRRTRPDRRHPPRNQLPRRHHHPLPPRLRLRPRLTAHPLALRTSNLEPCTSRGVDPVAAKSENRT